MREFDELNKLQRVQDIDTYFDEMELSDEQKEERKSAAHELEDVMIYILALIAVMSRYNAIDEEFIGQQIKERYMAVAERYSGIDDYITQRAEEFTEEVIRPTLENIEDEWYLSDDRATALGENEATTILGYKDLQDAIRNGKTKKQWITMRDRKVRHTHREVDGQVLKITEPFLVGDSLMMFAHDAETYSAEMCELANCRCATKYF